MQLTAGFLFVLQLLCLCGTRPITALEWGTDLPNCTSFETCQGDDVVFPWNFTTAASEYVDSYQYRRKRAYVHREVTDTPKGQNLQLFTSDPRFSFGSGTNSQLYIKNTIVNDTGIYSLMVYYMKSMHYMQSIHSVSLLVKDAPSISGRRLQAKLSPSAVKPEKEAGYTIMLSCGTFEYLGHPSVTVKWTTPSGTTLDSSQYSKSERAFILLVPRPIKGGSYSCFIPGPKEQPASACLPENSQLLQKAVVTVDEAFARILVLEAQSSDLQTEAQTQITELHQQETKQKDLESALHQQSAKQIDLESDFKNLTIVHVSSLSAIKSLDATHERKLQQHSSNLRKLESKNTDLKMKVQQQASKVTQLESENTDLKMKVQQQASKVTHLESENTDLKMMVQQQAPKVTQLELKNNDLMTELGQLEDRVNKKQHSVEKQISQLNSHVRGYLKPDLSNVALKKPTRQSSDYESGRAARAVDGNANTNYHNSHCTHTGDDHVDNEPWWRVDLRRTFNIYSVKITNRGDCCGERLHDFQVEIFDRDPYHQPKAESTLCFNYRGAMPGGATQTLNCIGQPTRGRYVRIRKSTEILALCEVQVLATTS